MYALIEQWEKSGLRQREFCHQHNLQFHTFKYYRTQKNLEENKNLSTSSFVPVKIKQAEELKGLTITYPNGVRVHLDSVIPSEQIKHLIHLY